LIDKFMPKGSGIGCRRPTPGNAFLEVWRMRRQLCILRLSPEISPTGFISAVDNQHHEIDIIIYAISLDSRFRPQ
jgi:hypothetical protein